VGLGVVEAVVDLILGGKVLLAFLLQHLLGVLAYFWLEEVLLDGQHLFMMLLNAAHLFDLLELVLVFEELVLGARLGG